MNQSSSAQRRALIVRGGWAGHQPVETSEVFIPYLEREGFDLRIETSPEVYADAEAMAGIDLVLQCVTMSEISPGAVAGLRTAVAGGMGFTGWHGGIADSFRASSDYLQLVGGQFAAHPAVAAGSQDSFRRHSIELTELGREHPVTAGLESFELTTEQYWVLHDDLNDVLATTTHPSEGWQEWQRPLVSPAVWTRQWGTGRVVVTTPGHNVADVENASLRTIIERGLSWAARTA